MAYLEYSTKDADFRQLLSMHIKVNKEPLDGLDAIVLETGSMEPEDVLTRGHFSIYHPMFKYASENDIPLYSVDNNASSKANLFGINWMDFAIFYSHYIGGFCAFSSLGLGPLAAPVAALSWVIGPQLIGYPPLSLSSKKANRVLEKIVSVSGYIQQTPTIALRDAIAAEKIEKFVVPKVKEVLEEKGKKKKPYIGINYGAGHVGIKGDLLSKKRRNFTLKLYSLIKFYPANKETLDTVWEAFPKTKRLFTYEKELYKQYYWNTYNKNTKEV